MMMHVATTLLTLALGTTAAAEDASQPLQTQLEYRPRLEKAWDGNLNARRGTGNFRSSHRARVTLGIGDADTKARISVQDVRVWATERNTLGDFSADGMDVHEAWGQLGKKNGVRVGRQEFNLDGQRLFGAVNWTQQGRSFDGVLGFMQFTEALSGRLFWSRVPDGGDHDLVVANVAFKKKNYTLSVPLILQVNDGVLVADRRPRTNEWTRFTGGLYVKGKGEKLSWRVEGYGQMGDTAQAFMAGARVGYEISPSFQPALWVDWLSGDDPSTPKSEAFDTMFATNHKFYGYMDRFLNVPAHTQGGGLMDVALKVDSALGEGAGKIHVAAHMFAFSRENGAGQSGLMGSEVDLIYVRPLTNTAKLVAGVAVFIDQGDFADGKDRTLHDWTFVQLIFNPEVS